jgi:anti-sigma-K factor RskA
MSSEETMSATNECGAEAAAYALGALEPDEVVRFKAHLDECAICRDELAAFEQVAGALPMAAPQYPAPRALRRRVLGQIHAEAKETAARRAPARPSVPRFRPAWAGALAGAVAVAAAVVIAVGTGGSGTHVYAASLGQARVRVSDGHAELIVDRLPQLSSGNIYEIWLQRPGGTPQPTKALFGVTHTGAADVGVPGDVRGVSQVEVTAEPAGGTTAPTTPAVIVAHL